MRQIGISEKDINLSQKIAKVIILELRIDHSNQDQTYRDAINKTQQLFLRRDLKTISLIVSRELSFLGRKHSKNHKCFINTFFPKDCFGSEEITLLFNVSVIKTDTIQFSVLFGLPLFGLPRHCQSSSL